ncbi:glycoside hydrolase family 6 protein [Parafrankia sp. EUN1f]|uniref:glycoside hydrolase family 6 protein n=1 Tax=Parafrankia sp. EUN1f TaxID=102897 RepID=UPI000A2F18E3|nr:glycoside hydrolase family 6 protein [Parafrankia sp. EUN1f]
MARSRPRRRLAIAAAVAVVTGFTVWTGTGPLPPHAGADAYLSADAPTETPDTGRTDAPSGQRGAPDSGPGAPDDPATASPSVPSAAPPSASAAAAPSAGPTPGAAPSTLAAGGIPGSGGNPIAGASFYVDPSSDAAVAARDLRATNPTDADLMARLARGSAAAWFGDADPATLTGRVRAQVALVRAAGALPVLVAYGIPHRDCGSYSAGGQSSPDAYRAWISAFAAGVRGNPAVVILEPDGLSQVDCLSTADRQTRYDLLRYAAVALTGAGAAVYLDAGNAGWHGPAEMATRLRAAGVEQARGFALNVSNFDDSASEIAYGRQISAALGGDVHFVVDTSRNGQDRAPDGAWCNPPGRGLGVLPTTATGDTSVDAFLWIKVPGESDGTCNGGPPAGQWWPEYALGLARRAA